MLLIILGFAFVAMLYGMITGKNIVTGNSYWTGKPISVFKKQKQESKDLKEYLQYKKNYDKVKDIINE